MGDLPELVRSAVAEAMSVGSNVPLPQLLRRSLVEQSDWTRSFPYAGDHGYLLFSGVTPQERASVIKLIRVRDGKVMAKWIPDWRAILAHRETGSRLAVASINVARAFNPLALPDGDVVFNNSSALVRMGPCSSKPVWVREGYFHHSVAQDLDGNLVVPAIRRGAPPAGMLREGMQDDAIARVSLAGDVLSMQSLAGILTANGLEVLMYGVSGHAFKADLTHLNSVEVARSGSRYWQPGDWLVSARNISTVLLYRPSIGKVTWYHTGPWLNQHSAAFLNDHQIVVYDNHVVSGLGAEQSFRGPDAGNRIVTFDFDTGAVAEPWRTAMAAVRLRSLTEGRVQPLADGGLFVEETNVGRQLRFSTTALMWSRVNDYDAGRIGLVTWSRYLTAREGDALAAVVASRCGRQ
jgi:hypothetical protein